MWIFNILTVIDKEYLLNIKKKDEEKVIKRFFIGYSLFFIFSCLSFLFTNFPGFLIFLFFPHFWILCVFIRCGPEYAKWTYILFENKYFKLSIIFTIIFFSLVILTYKYLIF